LAAALLSVMLAGCQSAMYGGIPDDMSGSVTQAPYRVGGKTEAEADEAPLPPAQSASFEGKDSVYRGGRDPVTGRAKIQM
jgi:hypothetical protein